MVTQSSTAGIKELRALAALAHSDHPFLTVFLNTEDTSVPADLQARLTDLLWQAHEKQLGLPVQPLELLGRSSSKVCHENRTPSAITSST